MCALRWERVSWSNGLFRRRAVERLLRLRALRAARAMPPARSDSNRAAAARSGANDIKQSDAAPSPCLNCSQHHGGANVIRTNDARACMTVRTSSTFCAGPDRPAPMRGAASCGRAISASLRARIVSTLRPFCDKVAWNLCSPIRIFRVRIASRRKRREEKHAARQPRRETTCASMLRSARQSPRVGQRVDSM